MMKLGILLAMCTLSCTAQVSDGTSITAKEFALKYGKVTTFHEFAHAIKMLGIIFIDRDFNDKLKSCYQNAITQGLWKDTYAISSEEEYFAEGVQSWFNVNYDVKKADGIHNEIDTNSELALYDPLLHKLISSYFRNDQNNKSLHFKKKMNSRWMQWDLKQ